MPMYEYLCEDCQKTTELLRPMANADEPAKCASCGSNKTQRQHSVFAVASDQTKPAIPAGCCCQGDSPQSCCQMQ